MASVARAHAMARQTGTANYGAHLGDFSSDRRLLLLWGSARFSANWPPRPGVFCLDCAQDLPKMAAPAKTGRCAACCGHPTLLLRAVAIAAAQSPAAAIEPCKAKKHPVRSAPSRHSRLSGARPLPREACSRSIRSRRGGKGAVIGKAQCCLVVAPLSSRCRCCGSGFLMRRIFPKADAARSEHCNPAAAAAITSALDSIAPNALRSQLSQALCGPREKPQPLFLLAPSAVPGARAVADATSV
ncbi:hypothetical protein IWW45_008931, partial [Coemansia sp. RSA 485]